MRWISGFGDAQVADLLALALDEHRPRRIEAAQGVPDAGVEFLLRRLAAAGHEAEHRAAMVGERFEVEHLRALRAPARRAGGSCPSRSGRRRRASRSALGQRLELGDDGAAEVAVAALEDVDAKADLLEHRRQRAAALAAAPAVDERRPFARLVEHVALDVRGDVARDQRGAALLRLERRDLLVLGADRRPLGIVERRPVDGAGQAVLGELALRARVDDGVEAPEVGDRLGGADRRRHRQRWRCRAGRAPGQARPRPLGGARGAWGLKRSRRASRSRSAAASCSAAARGPSIRKVSSTRSPRVVILASCRLMSWRASTREIA